MKQRRFKNLELANVARLKKSIRVTNQIEKKPILILLIILMSIFTGCFEKESKEKAPDFTLTDIDGNNFTLSDYQGKVIIINLMATWCLPCKEEMPAFVDVYEKYGDEIIMISIDTDTTESKEDLRTFKQEYNAKWIFAFDTREGNVADKYDILGIPSTFIIDKRGRISYSHYGPIKENELLEEILKAW